jgi:hypothetical protein
MIQLDHQLVRNAERILNGAMIFAYQQAVDLHNRQWPKHEVYQIQSEAQLRRYVREFHEPRSGKKRLLQLREA